MPIQGRKPKPAGQARFRGKHVTDWTEVPDVPYEDGPDLGFHPTEEDWPLATLQWWTAIRRMPHCALWHESDWRFAIDSAQIAAKLHSGETGVAAELRLREKVMGTTMDSLRDLRIRYVDPGAVNVVDEAKVAAMKDYRRMAAEADPA